jgi:lysozyme
VNRAVKVPLKPHEFDALVSFHFNTGAVRRAALTRHLNAGDKNKAAAAFMNWTRAGGKIGVLSGRRKRERALFEHGDYGNIASVAVHDRFPGASRLVSTARLLGKPLVVSTPQSPQSSLPTRSRRGWRNILAALAIAGAALAAFFLGAR